MFSCTFRSARLSRVPERGLAASVVGLLSEEAESSTRALPWLNSSMGRSPIRSARLLSPATAVMDRPPNTAMAITFCNVETFILHLVRIRSLHRQVAGRARALVVALQPCLLCDDSILEV